MTVLTNTVAAGIPGRLAPYRHTPRVSDGHRVPGCEGHYDDGTCSTEIADVAISDLAQLVIELYADPGEPAKLVAFTFDRKADATILRTSDPAQVQALADKFHEIGNDLVRAARVLGEINKREAA